MNKMQDCAECGHGALAFTTSSYKERVGTCTFTFPANTKISCGSGEDHGVVESDRKSDAVKKWNDRQKEKKAAKS